jgi:hypothetical protein
MDENRNREIIEAIRAELAPVFERLNAEVEPAPVYSPHDDTRD